MENQVQTNMPDSKIIIAEDDQVLDYWSKEFGISKEELTENVKAGRTSTEAVEKYVRKLQLSV
jgi:hypothetical protein